MNNELKLAVREYLPRLYAFAYQVAGDRESALRFTEALIAEVVEAGPAALEGAPSHEEALVGRMGRLLESHLPRHAEHSFAILESILRSDVTQEIDEDLANRPSDVHALLWELKRSCLTAVLGCLPPSVRLSFVLVDLHGYKIKQAADMLGIKESAFRVRLTRARKRLEDYLAPRCSHLDAMNPCRCGGRLGIALEAEFVRPPPHRLDVPEEPYDAAQACRNTRVLYRSLPVVKATDEALAKLIARL